jgi:hypothetical protein
MKKESSLKCVYFFNFPSDFLTLPYRLLYINLECYSIFSFMCMYCRSLSVLLWYTDSDYPFGIFKLFLDDGSRTQMLQRVSSSCSPSGTRRVHLVTNPVINHEWRKNLAWNVSIFLISPLISLPYRIDYSILT